MKKNVKVLLLVGCLLLPMFNVWRLIINCADKDRSAVDQESRELFHRQERHFPTPTNALIFARSAIASVNVVDVNATALKSTVDFPCPRVLHGVTTIVICSYDAKDDMFISDLALRGGLWEAQSVTVILNLLLTDPRRQLIDIGANLGTYTLYVAHFGIKVLAVEASWETMRRLARSVYVGGVTSQVTLLYNAVSNKHTVVSFDVNTINRGGNSIRERLVKKYMLFI